MRTSVHAKRKMLVYLSLFLALCIFSLIADSLAPHDAELVNLLEAKKYKSSKDTTKFGRLFPIKLKKRMTASVTLPFFTAARIPSGTESKIVTITEETVSFNVFGSAVSSFPDTAAPSM